MARPARQNDRSREPLIQRLDRAAGEINSFLMVLAIGLLILYLTCLFTLIVLHMPVTRMSPVSSTAPAYLAASTQ
jgi:hypothetical protein